MGPYEDHDLRVLITVALLTELQGQNRRRLWVLEIVLHSIEASSQGLLYILNVGHVALILERSTVSSCIKIDPHEDREKL